MRAGKLKSAITIDRRVETLDQFGTPSDTWIMIGRSYAEILSKDARTFLAEAGEETETAIVFRIRWRGAIKSGDRVIHAGDEFSIVEMKEVVRRRVLELRCTGSRS